ncbi:MAG: RIP metalloprotease RseP [Alphaproteobacteria bacterium]
MDLAFLLIDFLWTLVFYKTFIFLAVLTVLVFVHEMGHYLVAKWSGVRVVAFSIGFGPEIFGWYDKSGTRWKFCWIPLGGYVKMFGDLNAASIADPDAGFMSAEDKAVAFPYKPLYKRAAIVAAGPIANFILAIAIFTSVNLSVGQSYTPPVVGYVTPGSVAAEADIRAGDQLKSVNGTPITKFEDLLLNEQLTIGDELEIEFVRNKETFVSRLVPTRLTEFAENCRSVTYNSLGINQPISTEIARVSEGSAAFRAGLMTGDVITAINNVPVTFFQELRAEVRGLAGKDASLTYNRDGVVSTATATLGSREICNKEGAETEIGLLGVAPTFVKEVRELGLIGSVSQSFSDLWTFVDGTIRSIGQIVTGKRGTEDLGGPIGIANMVGDAAQIGILQLVMLTAILSLNLGLINLFPIPVLDGGHLVLYAYEAIRGKPLGAKGQEWAFKIGFMFIMGLMLFLFWNDILRAVGN